MLLEALYEALRVMCVVRCSWVLGGWLNYSLHRPMPRTSTNLSDMRKLRRIAYTS